jgi:hypothetical protein
MLITSENGKIDMNSKCKVQLNPYESEQKSMDDMDNTLDKISCSCGNRCFAGPDLIIHEANI